MDPYYELSVYQWIEGLRSGKILLSMSILSIKNKKPLTDGSITSMKMRPKVSFDTIDIDPLIHRRLCPAMNPVHR
jgi:hypothetical protein